jgi:teichuronic acid exporter
VAASAAATDTGTRARLAVSWATGFQLFRDAIQFALTLALVRLLPADAYGQFGFVTTLLGFFTLYSFREFLGYTIQVRDSRAVHYQDHFTAGAVVQACTVVLANGFAAACWFLPAYRPVAPVLHVMSILFVLDLPSEFRVKMLERDLDWRRLRALQATGFLASGLLSVAMALGGAGVYALLIPTLLAPLPFAYDLFVRARWRPTWAFSWDRFRPAWQFGWTRIAAVSFLAAASLLESAWLASALGFATLGVYGRAIGLAQLACGRVSGLLALSIYPVLTKLEPGTESFRRASALYLRVIAWVVLPAGVALAMLAAPVVSLLYGASWTGAIPLVPAAAIMAAFAALGQTGYTLLLAYGKQRQCLTADAWKLTATVVALALLLPLGPRHYLMALCVLQMSAAALVIVYLWNGGAVSTGAIASSLLPAFVSTALAAGALAVAAPAGFVTQCVVFGTVYLAALRTLFATPLAELVSQLPQSARVGRWLGFAARPSVELGGGAL